MGIPEFERFFRETASIDVDTKLRNPSIEDRDRAFRLFDLLL